LRPAKRFSIPLSLPLTLVEKRPFARNLNRYSALQAVGMSFALQRPTP
jgi:hypothetical protein